MKFKRPSFLLAVLVIAAAPIFADKIPGDSNSESKGSVSAQKQAEMKGLHDLYATGDCDLGGAKLNEVRPASMSNAGASSFSQGDKSGGLGGLVDSKANSGTPPLKVIDFGSNASDKDRESRTERETGTIRVETASLERRSPCPSPDPNCCCWQVWRVWEFSFSASTLTKTQSDCNRPPLPQ